MRRGSKHVIQAGHSAVRESALEKGNMIGTTQVKTGEGPCKGDGFGSDFG
jgi:hypothetical protein